MTDATIALVTGANKGIGYEIARQLGADGATVLLGARDPDRGQAAAEKMRDALSGAGASMRTAAAVGRAAQAPDKAVEGAGVEWVRLDVTDPATVEAAAKWVEREYGRLDVLVNNAGVALEWDVAPDELPTEKLRDTYEVNVFGVVAVTNAMLPLLRRSAAGRIVNLSSSYGSLDWMSVPGSPESAPAFLAYRSSKAAVNGLTVVYANLLRDTPIKVNACCPGYCATDMNGQSGPRTPAQGAAIAVRLATLSGDGPTGGFFNDDGAIPW